MMTTIQIPILHHAPLTVAYHRGPGPTLREAQRFVEGFVEIVPLDDGAQLLVNEDGHGLQLPDNPLASRLAGMPIVGNAILLLGTSRWTDDL